MPDYRNQTLLKNLTTLETGNYYQITYTKTPECPIPIILLALRHDRLIMLQSLGAG